MNQSLPIQILDDNKVIAACIEKSVLEACKIFFEAKTTANSSQ